MGRTDGLGVEVYWSVRSPYSYLVTPRLFQLHKGSNAKVSVRPVYPHAVRMPEMIESRSALWLAYFKLDIVRTADFLGLPLAWPTPDPVAVDAQTGRLLADQSRVRDLTWRIAAAEELGAGIAYIHHLSRLLWSPEVEDWSSGRQLDDVAARAGVDPEHVSRLVDRDHERLERVVQDNQRRETDIGHWGAPVMVFRGEPFFGQDRFDQLVWRLRQHGLEGFTEHMGDDA